MSAVQYHAMDVINILKTLNHIKNISKLRDF